MAQGDMLLDHKETLSPSSSNDMVDEINDVLYHDDVQYLLYGCVIGGAGGGLWAKSTDIIGANNWIGKTVVNQVGVGFGGYIINAERLWLPGELGKRYDGAVWQDLGTTPGGVPHAMGGAFYSLAKNTRVTNLAVLYALNFWSAGSPHWIGGDAPVYTGNVYGWNANDAPASFSNYDREFHITNYFPEYLNGGLSTQDLSTGNRRGDTRNRFPRTLSSDYPVSTVNELYTQFGRGYSNKATKSYTVPQSGEGGFPLALWNDHQWIMTGSRWDIFDHEGILYQRVLNSITGKTAVFKMSTTYNEIGHYEYLGLADVDYPPSPPWFYCRDALTWESWHWNGWDKIGASEEASANYKTIDRQVIDTNDTVYANLDGENTFKKFNGTSFVSYTSAWPAGLTFHGAACWVQSVDFDHLFVTFYSALTVYIYYWDEDIVDWQLFTTFNEYPEPAYYPAAAWFEHGVAIQNYMYIASGQDLDKLKIYKIEITDYTPQPPVVVLPDVESTELRRDILGDYLLVAGRTMSPTSVPVVWSYQPISASGRMIFLPTILASSIFYGSGYLGEAECRIMSPGAHEAFVAGFFAQDEQGFYKIDYTEASVSGYYSWWDVADFGAVRGTSIDYSVTIDDTVMTTNNSRMYVLVSGQLMEDAVWDWDDFQATPFIVRTQYREGTDIFIGSETPNIGEQPIKLGSTEDTGWEDRGGGLPEVKINDITRGETEIIP